MWERSRKGMACRVLARGGKNSILVEMEDGEYVVCCRYAVREIKTANSAIANSYSVGSSEELSLSTLFS